MEDSPVEFKKMTLGEHLEELRYRVIVSLVAVGVGMVVAWIGYDRWVLLLVEGPLDMAAGRYDRNVFAVYNPFLEAFRSLINVDADKIGRLNVFSMFEPLMVRLRVCMLVGFVMASPVVIHQMWKFVEAGLYPREKYYARVFGAVSVVLFLTGCLLCYWFLLPAAVLVLAGKTPFEIHLRLREYVSQAGMFIAGVGLVFETPLVVFFLNRAGIVGLDRLREMRRHVVVAVLLVAAVLTPPDPFTQLAVGLPMILMYESSILVLGILEGRRCVDGQGKDKNRRQDDTRGDR